MTLSTEQQRCCMIKGFTKPSNITFTFVRCSCTEDCNVTCANSTCNQNKTCIQGCLDGFYSQNCSLRCSEHCLNSTCSRENGTCLLGCEGDFFGDTCETSKYIRCARIKKQFRRCKQQRLKWYRHQPILITSLYYSGNMEC